MQRFLPLHLLLLACLFYTATSTIAQSNELLPATIKITKTDAQGNNAVCSIQDAVKLVRLIMAQDGVERCETDLHNQQLRLVTRQDVSGQEVFLRPSVKDKLTAMGFNVDLNAAGTSPKILANNPKGKSTNSATSKELSAKAKTSPKPDCDNCGEQKVSDDVKKSVLQNANYGTEILIDLPMGNMGGNEGDVFYGEEMPTDSPASENKTSSEPAATKANAPATPATTTKISTPHPPVTPALNSSERASSPNMPATNNTNTKISTQPTTAPVPNNAIKTTVPANNTNTKISTQPSTPPQTGKRPKESQLDSLRRVLFKRPK